MNTVVIFGASGDLTSRKLVPALYRLHQKGRLPEDTQVVGVSRRDYPDQTWREMLAKSTERFAGKHFDSDSWNEFASRVHYRQGDVTSADQLRQLGEELKQLENGAAAGRLYYLSTSPSLYEATTTNLGQSGLADTAEGTRRIVIEKPFGSDLESAHALNECLHGVFDESQVYRIDHYLGKEAVQNILVLRFANSIFEPIWNRNFVDHVQITVAEEVQIGSRAGYYDTAGVLRDMFQNHLLQLMTIVAMEAPARFEANLVRDEKVKVLQAVRPMSDAEIGENTVRGRYEGYADEEGVAPDSETATFAAMRLFVDNWRWRHVPFYLRSGKAMSCRTTQIVIQFHAPPLMLFGSQQHSVDANRLLIQIQPAEGIQLQFQTKVPDAGMRMRMTGLDFRFSSEFSENLPDAYQRLLLDALTGDASLFARSDEVEMAWRIIDPIIHAWRGPHAPSLDSYPVGMWGPESCTQWIQGHDEDWFDVCPVL